jgi:hypothetical protein
MRSDLDGVVSSPMANDEKARASLTRAADGSLRDGERVVTMLPYTHVPKRPKGPLGKVKDGIYQSYRRYRPLVLTDRRLLIFDTGRTPFPRHLLADFAVADVEVVSTAPGSFGTTEVVLELPGEGPVPFVAGKKDDGLDTLIAALGGVRGAQ